MPNSACFAVLLAAFALPAGATLAAPPVIGPQYIGRVSGDPERDTYGFVVTAEQPSVLCIVGPKRYFGPSTGNPETDNFGYQTRLVAGSSCPTDGDIARAGTN